MRLEYKPEAVKQIKKLPFSQKKKIIRKIEFLAQNPYIGKNLKGELVGLKSFRAWPYRIIYEIKDNYLIILSVVHRQSAY